LFNLNDLCKTSVLAADEFQNWKNCGRALRVASQPHQKQLVSGNSTVHCIFYIARASIQFANLCQLRGIQSPSISPNEGATEKKLGEMPSRIEGSQPARNAKSSLAE